MDNDQYSSIELFDLMLNACAHMNQCERAELILKKMDLASRSKPAIKANLASYSKVILCYSLNRRHNDAERVFHEMLSREIAPTVQTLNSWMSACSEVGDYDSALAMFKMVSNGSYNGDKEVFNFSNLITYNIALSACAQGGYWRQASEILKSMKKLNVEPDIRSYTCSILACEKENRWEQASKLFAEMISQGISPDNVVYTAMIRLGREDIKVENAKRVLAKMKASGAAT